MKQKIIQIISVSGTFVAAVVGIWLLQQPQLKQLKNQQQVLSKAEYTKQVEREAIRLSALKKVPVFGFDNLFADWVFLQFLQYFGDQPARQATGTQLSPEYFEIVLDQDPRFLEAYLFLSGSTSLYAGMPERTVAIMNRNLPKLSSTVPPKAYYIWRYKATDELLFLGDAEAATDSFLKAADWASVYNDEESERFERLTRRTAQFLAQNPNSRAARISTWMIVYNNAFDQATRQLAVQQIEALGATISVNNAGQLNIQFPEEESEKQ